MYSKWEAQWPIRAVIEKPHELYRAIGARKKNSGCNSGEGPTKGLNSGQGRLGSSISVKGRLGDSIPDKGRLGASTPDKG